LFIQGDLEVSEDVRKVSIMDTIPGISEQQVNTEHRYKTSTYERTGKNSMSFDARQPTLAETSTFIGRIEIFCHYSADSQI
jgi:hypothetical protein